jgi:hypothetical protein
LHAGLLPVSRESRSGKPPVGTPISPLLSTRVDPTTGTVQRYRRTNRSNRPTRASTCQRRHRGVTPQGHPAEPGTLYLANPASPIFGNRVKCGLETCVLTAATAAPGIQPGDATIMSNATSAWTTRIWQEYRSGNLTRAARDVLLCLRTFRGPGGTAWPSHATLADRARCCTRTVARALAQAQALGLVDWCERRVRVGWRWLQSSNRYWFTTPSAPMEVLRQPKRPRAAQTDSATGEGRGSNQEALDAILRAAAAAPDLLLARRMVMEGRLVAEIGHA